MDNDDKDDKLEKMDKIVKRVTVVQGSGSARRAEAIYEKGEDKEDKDKDKDDDDEGEDLRLGALERSLRHFLKAQLVGAQELYQGHLDAVEKGGMSWLTDAPDHFLRASRKGFKEMRKAIPFGSTEDESED